MLLEAQDDAEYFDRSIVSTAVFNFQRRRQFLLECLRLTLTISVNSEIEENGRAICREIVALILGGKESSIRDGPTFIQRCLQAMFDIENWLQGLGQRQQGAIALGQQVSQEGDDIGAFQQQSLTQQHESLSGIIIMLVKASYSSYDNFITILQQTSRIDRWGSVAVHYAPIILASVFQHGSPDGSGSLREARALHQQIVDHGETSNWALRQYQAAIQAWWLAGYSGWYQEQQSGSPVEGISQETEALQRSECFLQALKDGAFEMTLDMCFKTANMESYDPARSSLIEYLLRDAPSLQQDAFSTSDWFETSLMEELEIFVDALISNMPDTLRQFKSEEDDQRKRMFSNLQKGTRGRPGGQDLHLERFLMIISFSYDKRMEAAHAFWSDMDSNLYGFLQWASKRQSTPCVSAFCEMLQSISKSEEYATSAHQFLLDEGAGLSSRSRRYGSLSWTQILGELSTFTARIKEPPNTKSSHSLYGAKLDAEDINEPESVLMLENYLRLMSHICTESSKARIGLLSQSSPPILESLFSLCNNAVPSRLQACAFMAITSLLVAKTTETAFNIWTALDAWASGTYAPIAVPRPSKISSPTAWLEEVTFKNVNATFDQANEFTILLNALITPFESANTLCDQLPFPENLGSSYRMAGVEPYLDLAFDRIFTGNLVDAEDQHKVRVLNNSVLNLLLTCLDTFNEDLLTLASKSAAVDTAINASSLANYVRLHPFSRSMEWLFNDRVLSALFRSAHVSVEDIIVAQPGSVLLQSLTRTLRVMDLLLDLQCTYLNVVRPLLEEQSLGHRELVSNPSLASFEDSVTSHLYLITDIGLYAGSGHQELAACSLNLLRKLGSSRRLRAHPIQSTNVPRQTNTLIAIMERDEDLERIAKPLSMAMDIDHTELEQGPFGSAWSTKSIILEFLLRTLSVMSDEPNIAHTLLGFSCREDRVEVATESQFAKGTSLFHAVVQFVAEYPDGHESELQLWALSIRQMGMEVLSILWNSPLTSSVTLLELRQCEFLFRLILRQRCISTDTLFDERNVRERDFILTQSAEALQAFLWQRKSFYEYVSIELRLIEREGSPSFKSRMFWALLGITETPAGEQLTNPTIFELLDFLDVQPPYLGHLPRLEYFNGINIQEYAQKLSRHANPMYDARLVEQALTLRLQELRRTEQYGVANDDGCAVAEATQIANYVSGANNQNGLFSAKNASLAAWCQLLALIFGISGIDSDQKKGLLLHALQILTPKLEVYAFENDSKALDISKLLRHLITLIEQSVTDECISHSDEIINGNAFQVFRAALRSMSTPDLTTSLRESLYHLCHSYLAKFPPLSQNQAKGREIVHALRTAGARTLDFMCDDILGASQSSRISALLVLDALCSVAIHEQAQFVVERLVRTNFLQVLVEGIENMSNELRETNAEGCAQLLF